MRRALVHGRRRVERVPVGRARQDLGANELTGRKTGAPGPDVERRAGPFPGSLEAQARAAARAAVDGEYGLGHRLARGQAAPRQKPNSAGEMLPPPLLRRLEAAFDADLQRVRVHRDAAADSAARAARARAFTAGADIFFANGEYRPDTEAGFELLAHETAHVIQQTGRKASEGALRVDSVYGTGRIQREGGDGGGSDATGAELWPLLRATHVNGRDSETEFIDFVDSVGTWIGESVPFLQPTAAGRRLEARVLAGDFDDYRTRSTSLIYDVLKFMGLYEGPLALLQRDREITTAGTLGTMTLAILEDQGLDAVAPLFAASGPSRHRTYYRRLLDAWRDALLSTTGREAPTNGLSWTMRQLRQEATDLNSRGMNDLQFLGFQWLEAADAERTALIEQAWTDIRADAATVPDDAERQMRHNQAWRVASAIRYYADDRAADWAVHAQETGNTLAVPDFGTGSAGQPRMPAASQVGAGFMATYWNDVANQAAAVVAFWERAYPTVVDFLDTYQRYDARSILSEAFAPPPHRQHAHIRALGATLANHAATVFASATRAQAPDDVLARRESLGDRLLAPATYQDRLDALRTDLDALRGRIESTIRQIYNVPAAQRDMDVVDEIGWIIPLLDVIEQKLAGFDPDSADVDARLEHRVQLATFLSAVAHHFRFERLRRQLLPVLEARHIGFSYLVLKSDWIEEEATLPISTLGVDIPGRVAVWAAQGDETVSVDLPITGRTLASFYQLTYLEAFAHALDAHLREYGGRSDAEGVPTLADLVAAAEDTPRPRRWRVDEYRFTKNPSDPTSASELIHTHPRTTAMHASNPDWLAAGLVLSPRDRTDKVVAWLIPPLTDLVDRLRTIPAVEAIVETWDAEPIEPIPWLVQLTRSAADTVALETAITAFLRERVEQAGEALVPRLRQVAALERRMLAPVLIRLLDAYADDWMAVPSAPYTVLERARSFTSAVHPTEDRLAHHALLFLTLGPALERALGDTRSYSLIQAYFGPITLALDHSDPSDADAQARLRRVLHSWTKAGGPRVRERLDWFLARRANLEAVLSRFEEVRRESQTRFGFEAPGGEYLKSFHYAPRIHTGTEHAFEHAAWSATRGTPDHPAPFNPTNRVYYEITAIHRAFRYHPDVGILNTAGYAPPILVDENGDPIPEGTPLLSLTYAFVAADGSFGNDHQHTVLAGEVGWLNLLSAVIEGHAFAVAMGNLAETIESAVEIGMDLAELIPGVGQGIAVARILAGITEFLRPGGQFDQIREHIVEDPYAYVQEMITAVRDELLTPERVWNFLVLGGAHPLQRFRNDARARSRRGRQYRGRLGKLIAAVGSVGGRVAESVQRMRSRMQPPLIAAQARVAANPRLGVALYELPDVWINVQAAAGALSVAERNQIFGGILDDPDSLADSLTTLLEGLQELELPGEVFPLDLTIDVILGFALDRIGGGKGRILRRVLDATGALQEVSEQIAQALAGTELDPNQLWRDEFLPQVQARFEGARDDLVASLYRVLGQVTSGLPGGPIRAPSARQLPTVDLATEDFPELEPYFAEDRDPETGPVPRIHNALGARLPADVRSDRERRFGHDFGHVRIHRGPAASALTRRFGARALTSGSHIFLSPDLSIHSSLGRRVLDHELAHVLQQSGPRPLGMDHGDAPVAGRPGKGLVHDDGRERAADRMARHAAVRKHGVPVPIEEEGGEGMLPSMADVALRVTRVLAAKEFAGEFVERVEAETTTARQVPGLPEARGLWTAVRTELRGLDVSRHPRFMRTDADARQNLRTYVTESARSDIERVIPGLASMAQAPVRGQRGQQQGQRTTELQPRRFANLLEAYIFSRTGVTVEIRLRRGTIRPQSVEVTYIDLGRASRNAGIWGRAKANTDAHVATSPRPTWRALSESDWRQIRIWLASLGPQLRVWDGNEFRLSNAILDDVFEFLTAGSTVTVGDWEEYTTTDSVASTFPGLRVATHGALTTGRVASATTDRDSHHIPQHLLAQYFHNTTDPALFGDNDQYRLPGFSPETHPTRFTSDIGEIDIGKFAAGDRSDELPAIHLARETHQRGKLHLNREYQWNATNESQRQPTQGHSIHNYFQRALKSRLELSSDATQADVVAAAQDRERDVHEAIRDTYHWMYDDRMRPALKEALRTLEAPYYARAAARDAGNVDGDGELKLPYNPLRAIGRLDTIVMQAVDAKQSIMTNWRRGS